MSKAGNQETLIGFKDRSSVNNVSRVKESRQSLFNLSSLLGVWETRSERI